VTRAALVLGLCGLGVVLGCTPADVAAEKKAVTAAVAKVNAYCDARQQLLESLDAPDAGSEAGP